MISSVLGAVIMSAATISMLIALRITNDTFESIGREPLTEGEKNILIQAGIKPEDHNTLNNYIKEIIFE